MNRNIKLIKFGLLAIFTFVALTAFFGGLALIVTNGLGAPTIWLEGSIFGSYTAPGVFLIAIAVINLVAAIHTLRNLKYSKELDATAGVSLIYFEFFQLYIIGHSHWLQILYFSLGTTIIILTMFLLRYEHT